MPNENNNRKSICFITDMFIVGGVEKVFVDTVKMLEHKYDITLVIISDTVDQEILQMLPSGIHVKICGIKSSKAEYFRWLIPWYAKRFFNKILGERKFDYVISMKQEALPACYSICAKRFIYWIHGENHTKYANGTSSGILAGLKKCRLKTIYKKYDMIWTVTQEISNAISTAFDLKNVYTLPNPLDCNGILQKANLPCDFKFNDESYNIVMLGRLSGEKGYDRVIKILSKEISEKNSDIHLYIIGEGGERKKLESLIRENDLSKNITLLGQINNPYPYLKQAQLFILASLFESFGLVTMEAMLLGVPTIVTNTTGGKYVTQNGKYAYCVENDDNELKECILKVIGNRNNYPYSLSDAAQWVWKHDLKAYENNIIQLLETCNDL